MQQHTPFDLALNYLSYRPRTEKEVRDYLKKKELSTAIIKETLQKLKDYGYINDKVYIENYIDFNRTSKRFGLKRLCYDLEKKGISKDGIEYVSELFTEDDQQEFCLYHFKKIKETTEGQLYKKRIPKIQNYLMRRGFNYKDYSHLIEMIPREESIDLEMGSKDLNHYLKLYTKKGYEGSELKNRVIRGLMSKGYPYDTAKTLYDNKFDS